MPPIERIIEWIWFAGLSSTSALILYLIEKHEKGHKPKVYEAFLRVLGGGLAGVVMIYIATWLEFPEPAMGAACGIVGAIGAGFIKDLADALADAVKKAITGRIK